MNAPAITDWDDAYANADHIEGADAFVATWPKEAEAFRTSWIKKDLDIHYGPSDRQRLDMFHPEQRPKGLVVFVHGGYWLRFGKSDWSHFATGALGKGWSVCLPGYDLAPQVRISDITCQIGAAIQKAAERVEGPIHLAGHSAGGHLVTRMICEGSPLSDEIRSRIEAVVSISGLHDLRPLLNTKMNDAFAMSESDAIAESPALLRPSHDCRVVAWVGSDERPEFLRQSQVLAKAWPTVAFHKEAGKHHFNVIDGLKDPSSELMAALIGD
ncbi:alpha/beta hydrolase [Roseibium denhamense]|uniref:Acetyl esterase/lipase n=1 Tax=Roseibium denhamense TaxID=76305 RepID=A0ABY1PHE9_9HYPH|nr:alpha/beta hydrolase [Roseibium denhamense]MTI06260.1 alpha/beta hydrolase [Roseibium denhamense]SMP32924.1 Acetyl esterase/lipase [Roseibium denhamense]